MLQSQLNKDALSKLDKVSALIAKESAFNSLVDMSAKQLLDFDQDLIDVFKFKEWV